MHIFEDYRGNMELNHLCGASHIELKQLPRKIDETNQL